MASDMRVRAKQRCVIEFLHAEKIAPNEIHQRLLNIYGDKTVDLNTVKQWLMRLSSGDNDTIDNPVSEHNINNDESINPASSDKKK